MSGFDTNYLYLLEARRQLQSAGFEVLRDDDLLRVFLDDRPLCRITNTGAVRYRPEDIAGRDKAFDTVQGIAQITREYMSLLEQAPSLKAESLHENYKLLSEFNGIVLAGRITSLGVQFVTWEWTYNRTGLNQGHYYEPGGGGNYTAAKRDFVTRSGLLPSSALFEQEQMAEIHRCIQETLESEQPMADKRRELLEKTTRQIEDCVPDLEKRMELSRQKDMEVAEALEEGGLQLS